MNVSTAVAAVRTTGTRPAVVHRGVLALAAMVAVAVAVAAAHDGASARAVTDAGPELTRVLRFMALVKAALAAGGLWWADWRLRRPATPVVAAVWITACALMVAATGLIWSVAHVAAGAAAFHAGFALLLVLGWMDRADSPGTAPRTRPGGGMKESGVPRLRIAEGRPAA